MQYYTAEPYGLCADLEHVVHFVSPCHLFQHIIPCDAILHSRTLWSLRRFYFLLLAHHSHQTFNKLYSEPFSNSIKCGDKKEISKTETVFNKQPASQPASQPPPHTPAHAPPPPPPHPPTMMMTMMMLMMMMIAISNTDLRAVVAGTGVEAVPFPVRRLVQTFHDSIAKGIDGTRDCFFLLSLHRHFSGEEIRSLLVGFGCRLDAQGFHHLVRLILESSNVQRGYVAMGTLQRLWRD